MPNDGKRDYLTPPVVAALLALAAVLVARVAMRAAYPFPLESSDGTVLIGAWKAAGGQPIYREILDPPYFFTVYNPLFIYLAAPVMKAFGPSFAPVRILSASFLAGAAAVIYAFVALETGRRRAGVVAGLFFLVEFHVFARAGNAIVDCAAIFFSLLGLLLWRQGRRVPSRGYWAVAAFSLAFFSKQTAVVAAAAAVASIFLVGQRRASLRLFILLIAAVCAGTLACGMIFGRAYFTDTLAYAGVAPLVWRKALAHVGLAISFYAVLFGGWVALCARAARNRNYVLPAVYVFFGLVMALSSGRVGASKSYFFDLAAGLAIVAGTLWADVVGSMREGRVGKASLAAVAVQLALIAAADFVAVPSATDRLTPAAAQGAMIADVYRSHEGVVFAIEPGYDVNTPAQALTNDGHRLGLLIEAGKLPRDILLEPLRRREFSAVIMPEGPDPWNIFTDDVRAEVEANYDLYRAEYGRRLYAPRRETP